MKLLPAGVRQSLDRLRRRLFPGPIILRYHRIADPLLDPYALCVSPERFAEHLVLIKRHAVPMQLRRLVQLMRNGTFPRRAVVVTFDDGYADNLYLAKPLLERHGIPATVFVTTSYTQSQQEFWSDALEQIVLSARPLPRTMNLTRGGTTICWELGETANYDQTDHQRDRAWNVRASSDPSSRHGLFRRLHDTLKPLAHDQRSEFIAALQTWAGFQVVVRNTHKPLSASELIRLADGKLIEIGAHSATHPVLSKLSTACQRQEVLESKTFLERLLGAPVISFAYPYGHPCDYTVETIDILKQVGFDCACSTISGRVNRRADLFQLPRLYVGNWDAETFRRQCLDRLE